MRLLTYHLAVLLFCSCDYAVAQALEETSPFVVPDLVAEVDAMHSDVTDNIRKYQTIKVIDHSRLAKKTGVVMPPAVVTIFSDPAINTPLVKIDPRIGLDLPFKVLAYLETDRRGPMVAFVTVEYLAKRHGVKDVHLFKDYEQVLSAAMDGIPQTQRSPTSSENVVKGYGLIELQSDYGMEETTSRLKKAVLGQGDTVWFGEIDYQKDADSVGVKLRPAILLLFGGPWPGGKAMADFPKLGLDAFCQKLLVYEDSQGQVRVAFNDIVAFAELHYGKSNVPQKVINGRLTKTFSEAIREKK